MKVFFIIVVIFFAISFAIFLIFSFIVDVFIINVIVIFIILLNFFFFSVIVAFAIFFIANEIDLFSSLFLTMLFLLKIFKDHFIKEQLIILIIASLLNEINDSCFIFLIKKVDCFDDEIIFDDDLLIHYFVFQFDQLNFKLCHVIALREH